MNPKPPQLSLEDVDDLAGDLLRDLTPDAGNPDAVLAALEPFDPVAGLPVRVVGKAVRGRREAVVIVTDPTGVEVRVRWRDWHGYRCDAHPETRKPVDCIHAGASARALRLRRAAERRRPKGKRRTPPGHRPVWHQTAGPGVRALPGAATWNESLYDETKGGANEDS